MNNYSTASDILKAVNTSTKLHASQKGLAPIILLISLLGISLVAGGIYLVMIQCPDGTVPTGVGCQGTGAILHQPTTLPVQTIQDETANWKAYENSQGGFTFKYPVDWQIEEVKPQKFSEDILLLKTNTLTGILPNPSQILEENYRIRIALLLNPDKKMFREVYDSSALSFGQGFSNTPINIIKGSINNLTTYETTSIFSWNGAFGIFFEAPDLNEYIAFILTPYKKDSPYKGQSDIYLAFNKILSTFRFLP